MKASEFNTWLAYRAKYGTMSDVRRYDRPAALLATVINRALGGKAKLEDFMPFGFEDKEATVEDVIASFGELKGGR